MRSPENGFEVLTRLCGSFDREVVVLVCLMLIVYMWENSVSCWCSAWTSSIIFGEATNWRAYGSVSKGQLSEEFLF